jgi:predicted permease
MRSLLARARSFWRGLRHPELHSAAMEEEMRFHIEMEAERIAQEQGVDPEEAHRQAAIAFGGIEKRKEEGRDVRGLTRVHGFSLDLKLAWRMLWKYPGLTLIGGLAIAFAIWVGAAGFEIYRQVLDPTIPLPGGEGIVGIQNLHRVERVPARTTLYDFVTWREAVKSVEDLGAFRALERNLITHEGRAAPVAGAEISASAFRVARVAPLLGRTLVATDEEPGASSVVVIGYDLWQSRFGREPGIVGREVRLGGTVYTIVGVMPEGFAFPVAQSLWVPLRLHPEDYAPGDAPEVRVFGRLAPGVTRAEAQAEIGTLGLRAAAALPDTHRHLRPRVLPYATSIMDASGELSRGLLWMNAFLVLLLALVSGNVALLMFARAAAREGEIVVRSALGASRGRIVAQLFLEALVLGSLAAALGLAAASFALRVVMQVYAAEAGGRLPFWFHATLSPATVLYAVGLTLLGAAIAGIVPALKVTHGLRVRLQQASAGGGGFRFGGVWTAVIVAQVAATVAFPVTAFLAQREVARFRSTDVGFASEAYLSARVDTDRERPSTGPAQAPSAAFAAQSSRALEELQRRLEADPAVVEVTFADRLPRMYHPPRRIEVEAGPAARPSSDAALDVGVASVAVDYFQALDAPVFAGRDFRPADLQANQAVVIGNQSFVDRVLGGHNALGRRVRYATRSGQEPGPWYEIVGVVRDLGMINEVSEGAGLYHPLRPGDALPVRIALKVRGEPAAFGPRMRAIAAAVDPDLRLEEILPLDVAGFRDWSEMAFLFRVMLLICALALLLALAGIYSVMAFTVSQRTREIGIRMALGTDVGRLIGSIFRRPLTQVGVGVLSGGVLATVLVLAYYGGGISMGEAGLLLAYTTLVLGVCMLACVVPTRRALQVEPTEALRAEP